MCIYNLFLIAFYQVCRIGTPISGLDEKIGMGELQGPHVVEPKDNNGGS